MLWTSCWISPQEVQAYGCQVNYLTFKFWRGIQKNKQTNKLKKERNTLLLINAWNIFTEKTLVFNLACPACPDGWKLLDNHCYKVFKDIDTGSPVFVLETNAYFCIYKTKPNAIQRIVSYTKPKQHSKPKPHCYSQLKT